MKTFKQAFRHAPEKGVYGDCFRTCIACLLDFDEPADVPHFYDNGVSGEVALKAASDWLEDCGLMMVDFVFDCDLAQVLCTMENLNPNADWMLGGTSETGVGHTVLAHGGKIVHDPSLNDAGIVGPMEDGHYWVTFLCHRSLSNV